MLSEYACDILSPSLKMNGSTHDELYAHNSLPASPIVDDPIDNEADDATSEANRGSAHEDDHDVPKDPSHRSPTHGSSHGSSLHASSHHSRNEFDQEGSINDEDEDAEDALELDSDDLIVQDECSDEEIRGEKIRRIRSKSESALLKAAKSSRRKRRQCSSSPIGYRPPTPIICGESVEIEGLMHKAQFFLAKSCRENIRLAKEKSLWTTTRNVEKMVGDAFFKVPVVILIFLEKDADHFAGFAKVSSQALYKGQPAIRWKNFAGGGNIRIRWISRCPLDLRVTKNIKNPFNKEREIYVGQDGCEVQRAAGQRLCSLFPFDEGINLGMLRKSDAKWNPRKKPVRKRGRPQSLLDTRISYSQFKRAKRDLSLEEMYEKLRREELEFLLESSRTYRELSRRSLLTEVPRSLLFDDLSYSLSSRSIDRHRRDRSPIPSLLEGVVRSSGRSSLPVRLVDKIRGRQQRSPRRRVSPRRTELTRRDLEVSRTARNATNRRASRTSRERKDSRSSADRKERERRNSRSSVDRREKRIADPRSLPDRREKARRDSRGPTDKEDRERRDSRSSANKKERERRDSRSSADKRERERGGRDPRSPVVKGERGKERDVGRERPEAKRTPERIEKGRKNSRGPPDRREQARRDSRGPPDRRERDKRDSKGPMERKEHERRNSRGPADRRERDRRDSRGPVDRREQERMDSRTMADRKDRERRDVKGSVDTREKEKRDPKSLLDRKDLKDSAEKRNLKTDLDGRTPKIVAEAKRPRLSTNGTDRHRERHDR